MRNWAFLFAAGLLAGAAPHAEAAQAQKLGTFNDWTVYRTSGNDGLLCFAIASPKETAPANVKRDPIYFMVSAWPGKNVSGEPYIEPGYPYKDGSKATVEIGADSFEFYTENAGTDGGAWLQGRDAEKRLLAAMRAGSTMIVKGTSRRGTLTTDTYSLSGISLALDKIATDCK